jgi:carboxypeptidase D
MLFGSVASTALLALSLCLDSASAAKHGRFGQKARDSLAKRSSSSLVTHEPETRSRHKDFRFLNKDTKRMYIFVLPALELMIV